MQIYPLEYKGEDLKEEGMFKQADNLLQATSGLCNITFFLMMGRTPCLLKLRRCLAPGSLASVLPVRPTTPIPPRPPTTVALLS